MVFSCINLLYNYLNSLEDVNYIKWPSKFRRITTFYLQKKILLIEILCEVQALDDLILWQILQNVRDRHLTYKDLANAERLYLKDHPNSCYSEICKIAKQQKLKTREWLEKNK